MRIIILTGMSVFFYAVTCFSQGSLTPPGAPGETMKTLDQIEPRTPIGELPFTINEPGSYYLARTLEHGVHGSNGIDINADNVTLDLNGFALIGTGSGDNGVGVSGSDRRNICVKNGTIYGWGSVGIRAEQAHNSQLLNLRVSDNGDEGMWLGDNTLVKNCIIVNNGDDDGTKDAGLEVGNGCTVLDSVLNGNADEGLLAGNSLTISRCSIHMSGSVGIEIASGSGEGSLISDCNVTESASHGISSASMVEVVNCVVSGAGGHGIDMPDSSTVRGCTVSDCDERGINGGTACSITESTVSDNGERGIDVGDGSCVYGCISRSNADTGILTGESCQVRDCTVSINGVDGIEVGKETLVVGNNCDDNSQDGIYTKGSDCRIDNNTLTDNNRNLHVTGGGNLIIRNSASGGVTENYNIAGSNSDAEILSPGSGFTATNPWANFEF